MEERILNALAVSPGKSAKEVARELGEATPIIMEHLLGLAASGALKQRTVGREQVFSIPKKAVPTPREILPTGATVSELIDAGHLAPLQQFGRIHRPLPGRESVPMFNMVPDEAIAPTRAWSLEKPTLYDRIGGTIELEIGDSPIRARFKSVEQLYRFLTDLIGNERAGQVPAEGKV